MRNPIVTMVTRRHGSIVLELFPELAPESVRNFIALVRDGFFNGQAFWRVEKDLLIQTGSPTNGVSFEGVGYAIKGEFTENGVANPLRFEPGTIGYGRLTPDSGSTHVFITVGSMAALDDKYAAFGRVTAGLEAVAAISRGPSEPISIVHRALDPEVIDRVEIETFGVDYPAPQKLSELTPEDLQAEMARVTASAANRKSESQS